MPVRLRIFSLNCWGVRYLSKQCAERYVMIGELLSKEQHDVALLQELHVLNHFCFIPWFSAAGSLLLVWSEKHFHFLKAKLGSTHPYSHYFKSGFFGSGLAVFSRHRIHDVFLYKYSLNGYPYMVHHGDWFGGKAVGKILLKISGLIVHIYFTHLHAEYSREQDSYLPHRVVQAWELQNFIRQTSAGADVVILGGDLNMHPDDLGVRLLRSYSGLLDCFIETASFDGCEQGFTHITDNPFTNTNELLPLGGGVRIDYILFKGSMKVDVSCESLSTTKGSVPGYDFPYSDHEALSTELLLCPLKEERKEKDCSAVSLSELINIVTEARTEVKVGLHCAERMRYTAARTGFMGLALLLLEIAIAAVPIFSLGDEQPFPKASFYLLGALCFTILLSAVFLYIFYSMEVKSLQGAEDHMRLAVGSLQECLKELPQVKNEEVSQNEMDGIESND